MRPSTSASRFPRRRNSLPHRRPVCESGAAMPIARGPGPRGQQRAKVQDVRDLHFFH
jgi:hypothetical protein